MKKLLLFLVLIPMSLLCAAQISQDSLFAVVDGNSVTLYDQGANRNCCAVYEMIITQEGQHLIWLQQSAGDICYCTCNFDIQATTGPLEAGSYITDVYYNDIPGDDPIYVGSIEFSIEMQSKADTLEIIDFYQSECYDLFSIDENKSQAGMIFCYPNPAETHITLACKVNSTSDIRILNALGQEVRLFKLPHAGEHTIEWDLKDQNGQSLKTGLYFYRLESGGEKITGKMMLM